MKKSKKIQLVLITAALASCNQKKIPTDWENGNGGKTYLRSDTTASYARSHYHGSGAWFYAFRSMYSYNNNGGFVRNGFSSNAIPSSSNIGTNFSKSRAVRGGFGRSSRSGG